MRVLLIQPPFWGVNGPSVGLSNLKASLEAHGVAADILYSNLEFAKHIGRAAYDTIQTGLPVDLLYGDLVFGPALHGADVRGDEARVLLRSLIHRPPEVRSVPEAFLDRFPGFAGAAIEFIERFQISAAWQGYDLVGLTTTFSLVPALAMAKAIKATGGSPPVILGGAHCEGSLGLGLMRYFPWIDFAGRGEWEVQIVALVEHLRTGKPARSEIDGLLWREGDRIREADRELARIETLDTLPVPGFQDWLAHIDSLGWMEPNALRLPLETARGCWFGAKRRCSFCGLNGSTTAFRTKSADRILGDYQALLTYGIPYFNAVDNVLDPSYFKEVIPRIQALERKAVTFFEIRPTLTPEQLAALRDAGFVFLQPGIESLDTRLLKLMNKGTTGFQNIRLLRWAAELGMPLFWNMLCGLPGEEAADYDRMVDLIPALLHLYPPLSGCNLVHVDRFSPLFERHAASIQPITPYRLALGLDEEGTQELAYHFEFVEEFRPSPDIIHALERLATAVQSWQASVGNVAFVILVRQGKRWLYDTRPNAQGTEYLLTEAEAQAYQLMDRGVSREDLDRCMDLTPSQLEALLETFLDRRWAVLQDGKFLSLAVPMDELVPNEVPESLQGDVAIALFKHRMAQMWKAGRE